MNDKTDSAQSAQHSSFRLLLALILSILVMLIFIGYNLVRYNTAEVSAVKDVDVEFSSASVLVSKPLYVDSNTLIKYKSICVLSSENGMSDEQAIKAALGNAKAYSSYSKYRVDVVRPCKLYKET